MKTVKFAEVVRRAGKPEIHLSWLPPEKDPELARALKQHRVLTIHQQLRGAKKDFGTIGLDRGAPGQILIFPRPLRRFGGRRVIAIDYKLLPHPRASERPAHFATPPRAAKSKAPDLASAPAEKNRGPTSPAPTASPASAARKAPRHAEPAGRSTSASAKRRHESRPTARKAAPTGSEAKLLKVIRAAATDLKVGRAVTAYERLQAVLDSVERARN